MIVLKRLAVLICCLAQTVAAYTELSFPDQVVTLTSNTSPTVADKARLLRLTDGTLVAAWHAGVGAEDGAWGVDGQVYPPRDIFVRTSTDSGVSWSPEINISATANVTDATVLYDRVGDGSGLTNFFGDSSKPNVFVVGTRLVVAWNDTYCGEGRHGPALYESVAGHIEVPFRCLYAARIDLSDGSPQVVAVSRITDAERDIANAGPRGTRRYNT